MDPRISTLLASGLGMILVAVLAWVVWRGRGVEGRFWLWGALAWAISVALKFAFAVPVNPVVSHTLLGNLPAKVAHPTLWIYVGLLTGIFEGGFSLLVIRYLKWLKDASWSQAVGFGLAFGAVEAFLLGVGTLLTGVSAATGALPPEMLLPGYGPAWAIAPVVERAFTIPIHVFSAVLIFYSVGVGMLRWFWLSFAYKSAIDAVAAFAQISYGLVDLRHVWTIEAVVIAFGLIGVWGTSLLHQHWPVARQ